MHIKPCFNASIKFYRKYHVLEERTINEKQLLFGATSKYLYFLMKFLPVYMGHIMNKMKRFHVKKMRKTFSPITVLPPWYPMIYVTHLLEMSHMSEISEYEYYTWF